MIAVTIIEWILKVEIRFQMELAMSTTQETLKSLLEIGESKGFVTFQQVFNAVTKEKSDPDRPRSPNRLKKSKKIPKTKRRIKIYLIILFIPFE